LDRDFASLNGPAWPVRSSEALVTAVKAGLTLQPNFQFIRHPGGGGTDPLGAMRGRPLKDAAVLGLRSVIKF
ncbi:carbohydrate porin, partial [Bradyrhizobium liaoningense]|uniref:carbohydrate porin n=1 Tax=Bradyrhizobium liaoningense TaxID=43992 RepID=UPI001BAB2E48